MHTSYYRNRRGGHCPGHVRETFCEAIEAFCSWNDREPEPTVEFEVRYVPRPISLTQACGLVWNCTDFLPGDVVDMLMEAGLDLKRGTYAAAARAMHAATVAQRGN